MFKTLIVEELTRELTILWQGISQEQRNILGDIIRDYFEGERAEKIINTLQIKV